ncbi:adenylate kinase 4 [Anaeramoeba flamelloides]|uniref:Adenylate kinase n=1 Tax=Anaeramoeba flamelloides TaxID=1746091 RepID=A0AAV7YHH1_9EUKA|nr:adenylate kinase [Anaeramoeba flamelloides]KAJ6243346.1 adenylate kinase 4 [Anaeramoeba flamelloides]
MTEQPKYIIFYGPPGCGKGSQARKISALLNIGHQSSGSLLRGEIANETEIGLNIKETLEEGKLVSNEIVNKVIKRAMLAEKFKTGILFDGYPRTLLQSKSLTEMVNEIEGNLVSLIWIDVPDNVLKKRILGRRTHRKSGRIYNIYFNPPKVEMKDDITGEPLTLRKDDTKEVLNRRLNIYHKEDNEILDYYRQMNKLIHIDGTLSIDETHKAIKSELTKFGIEF